MAKKVTAYIKLQIKAGQANPSPPVGPGVGSTRLEHHAILQRFQRSNTRSGTGTPTPVIITAHSDKSYTFILKTPPGFLYC
ncbi:MAG: hypothetical protein R3E08_05060 [Thiotrichaceae bacterium]